MEAGFAWLIDDSIGAILSVPFCPYHFVPYHFVLEPCKRTICFVFSYLGSCLYNENEETEYQMDTRYSPNNDDDQDNRILFSSTF